LLARLGSLPPVWLNIFSPAVHQYPDSVVRVSARLAHFACRYCGVYQKAKLESPDSCQVEDFRCSRASQVRYRLSLQQGKGQIRQLRR
jgi:hypothetical protein